MADIMIVLVVVLFCAPIAYLSIMTKERNDSEISLNKARTRRAHAETNDYINNANVKRRSNDEIQAQILRNLRDKD